jgi:hypothetical protein
MLLAGLALLLCAGPATGSDNPRKVAIAPGSPKGALLLKVPPLPIDYAFLLVRLDERGVPSRSDWIFIKPVPLEAGDRFIVATFPPGEYLLEGVAQQSRWVGCLHARTLKVSIEPGKIAYLGAVDARPTLASIQRNADRPKEQVAHSGQWHIFRDEIAAPIVTERDDAGLARAASFVRARMPKSSVAATLAAVKWLPYHLLGRRTQINRCV